MPLDGGAAAGAQVVTELEQQARKDGDVTARRLTDWPSRLQVPAELHRFGETFGAMSFKGADTAVILPLLGRYHTDCDHVIRL